MTGDDHGGADVVSELGGFDAREVAGDPAFGGAAVDGENGEVDAEGGQSFGHAGEAHGIAAVVDAEGAGLDDVTEVEQAAGGITIQVLVCGGYRVDLEGELSGDQAGGVGAVVEANDTGVGETGTFLDRGSIRFGTDHDPDGVGSGQGAEGVGIEVVGMVVAGGDDADEAETSGVDDTFGDADVGLVGIGVFTGEGIGEIGVDEEEPALVMEEIPGLTEPPEVRLGLGDAGFAGVSDAVDVGEEGIVLEERSNHGWA